MARSTTFPESPPDGRKRAASLDTAKRAALKVRLVLIGRHCGRNPQRTVTHEEERARGNVKAEL